MNYRGLALPPKNHRGLVAPDFGPGGDPSTPPAASDLCLWFSGDVDLTHGVTKVTAWGDRGPLGADVAADLNPLLQPELGDVLDGVQGVHFTGDEKLFNTAVDPVLSGQARTVLVVMRPDNTVGGAIFTFRRSVPDHSVFLSTSAGQQFVWSDGVTNRRVVTPVDYSGIPIVVGHVMDSSLRLTRSVNGVDTPLFGDTVLTAETGFTGFAIGGRHLSPDSADAVIYELLVWRRVLSVSEYASALAYVNGRFPSL